MRKMLLSGMLFTCYLSGFNQQMGQNDLQLQTTTLAAAEALIQLGRIGEATTYLDQIPEDKRSVEWQFLHAAADQSQQLVQFEQAISANDLARSPLGELLAVANSDSSILLYKYPEMKLLQSLKHHRSSVSCVSFSHDGRLLASGGRDHTVVIWEIATGQPLIVNDSAFSQGIYQVRFQPGDSILGVVSWLRDKSRKPGIFGFLKLLNTNTGKIVAVKELDNHPAAGLCFTPDGMQVVVSSWGEIIYGIQKETLETNWLFDLSDPTAYNAFHALDMNADGTTLAAGSADHAIYLLDVSDGKLLFKSPDKVGHTKIVKTVRFSPNGSLLASAGADQQIIIWDVQTQHIIKKLPGHTGTVTSLVWMDEETLLSAATDGSIRRWSLTDGFFSNFKICDYGPWQTPITSDHEYFAAPCSDDQLQLIRLSNGKAAKQVSGHDGLCAVVHPNDSVVYFSSFDGQVKRWNIYEDMVTTLHRHHTQRVDGLCFLSATKQLVTAGGKQLIVWDENKSDTLKSVSFDLQPFRVMRSLDEQYVLVGMGDGSILKIRTADYTMEAKLETGQSLQEMTMSKNGKLLGVFSGRDIYLIDYDSFTILNVLKGHTASGYGLDFSPDGRRLISTSSDQSLRFWDIESGACLLTWKGLDKEFFNCKFIGDQQIMLTTGAGELFRFNLR